MKPIGCYCKSDVPGWDKLPMEWFDFISEPQRPYFWSFFKRNEGIQLTCDTLCAGIIHVSLAPVVSMRPDLTQQQIVDRIVREASELIKDFFGDLEFVRMSDDPEKPWVKHFFHYLDLDSNPFSDN